MQTESIITSAIEIIPYNWTVKTLAVCCMDPQLMCSACDRIKVDTCAAISNLDHVVYCLGRLAFLANLLHWPVDII